MSSNIFDRDPQKLGQLATAIRDEWPKKGGLSQDNIDVILDCVDGMSEEGWGTNMMDSIILSEGQRRALVSEAQRILDVSSDAEDFLARLSNFFIEKGLAQDLNRK